MFFGVNAAVSIVAASPSPCVLISVFACLDVVSETSSFGPASRVSDIEGAFEDGTASDVAVSGSESPATVSGTGFFSDDFFAAAFGAGVNALVPPAGS